MNELLEYKRIQKILDDGGDVNAKENDKTYLDIAVENRHFQLMKLLIQRGSNLDNMEKCVDILMRYGRDKLDILDLLLDHGANPNQTFGGNYTMLIEAAQAGNLDLVNKLIKLGADVNAQAATGWTALHHALHYNHVDVAIALLNAGADSSLKTKFTNHTALDFANHSKSHPRYQELFKQYPTAFEQLFQKLSIDHSIPVV